MLLSVSANLRIGALFLICIFAVASISPLNVDVPANVETPATFNVLAFASPIVEIPLIESAVPTIVSARTDPPVNSPKTVL